MSYYNNRNQEPLPKEDISTWECTAEDCNGWMRKNFTS
ncbi:cold-shock protein, partial [Bacillus haynesii]